MHKGLAIRGYIYIKELEEKTPNDAEFGKLVRKHIKTLNKE